MHSNNFLQVLPGGHCFHCHKDYEGDRHDYWQCEKDNPGNYHYPCDTRCIDSKYFEKLELPAEYYVDEKGAIIKRKS